MKRFQNMSKTKRIVAVGLTLGLTLGLAGAAFAYFTSSGSGSGSASVGTATNFNVVQTGSFSGTLYPCGASTAISAPCGTREGTIIYTVTNEGAGAQELTPSGFVAKIDDSAGTGLGSIVTGGTGNATADPPSGSTAVSGCTAAWFGAYVTAVNGVAPAPVDLTANGQSGDTATVTVTVTMEDSGGIQNLCESQTPDVNLAVS